MDLQRGHGRARGRPRRPRDPRTAKGPPLAFPSLPKPSSPSPDLLRIPWNSIQTSLRKSRKVNQHSSVRTNPILQRTRQLNATAFPHKLIHTIRPWGPNPRPRPFLALAKLRLKKKSLRKKTDMLISHFWLFPDFSITMYQVFKGVLGWL